MAENARAYFMIYELAIVETIKWGYCVKHDDARKIEKAEIHLVRSAFEVGKLPIECVREIMGTSPSQKAQP